MASGTGKTIKIEVLGDASKAQKTFEDLGKSAEKSGGVMQNAMGTALGFVTGGAITSGLSSVFNIVKGGSMDMNSQLEKTTLQFETLMGSSDGAKAHVADLFEFAKTTPFETAPVIQASKMLRTFGGDALDTKENLTL